MQPGAALGAEALAGQHKGDSYKSHMLLRTEVLLVPEKQELESTCYQQPTALIKA